MKKILLFALLGAAHLQVSAQQTYTYKFNGGFTESSGNGPALQQICTGMFMQENLPDYNINQQVYHFDNNCGFSFDDAGGFLANGSYTIELYFKMSGLASWKRVIDFKNRTTDKGCYVLNGQMNFYNIATSSGTPFLADEYSHYVITRDNTSKQVVMYGDGNHYIMFTDTGDDAVYDATKKISFFHDDLVVPNESSEGAIAILKIHNYAMDSTTVKASYNNLSGALTSVLQPKVNSIETRMFPNPATDEVSIQLPSGKNAAYNYQVSDAVGKVILFGTMKAGNNTLSISSFAKGIYNVVITDNGGNSSRQQLLKH